MTDNNVKPAAPETTNRPAYSLIFELHPTTHDFKQGRRVQVAGAADVRVSITDACRGIVDAMAKGMFPVPMLARRGEEHLLIVNVFTPEQAMASMKAMAHDAPLPEPTPETEAEIVPVSVEERLAEAEETPEPEVHQAHSGQAF